MLFNSLEFAFFLPVVWLLHWLLSKFGLRAQNAVTVGAGYFFYGWWDPRFLLLILLSTIIDYIAGLRMAKCQKSRERKPWLYLSVAVNLGLLIFFKYFNFFSESFVQAFTFFGVQANPITLNIILPVGISFYTFQTMSYTIDVYRGKVNSSKNFMAFAAYVGFFPQLVAGPIERAQNLLPQFLAKRTFSYTKGMEGLTQIAWGLFKKMVIADSCSPIVNAIFENHGAYNSPTLLLGLFLFAFQIYGDFSGYSDVAIGTAKLFGIRLMTNFRTPYFSRDIADFWRRWHISLTTWFKDYVYIPIGGNRLSKIITTRNVLIVFTISGLWHGANLTFVAWGVYNALVFLPLMLLNKHKTKSELVESQNILPKFKELVQMSTTFLQVLIGWAFFRAQSMEQATSYLGCIFSVKYNGLPYVFGIGKEEALLTICSIACLIAIEWQGRHYNLPIVRDSQNQKILFIATLLLAILIFLFGAPQQDFIYFQF